jgi:hypothetical protein
LEYCIKDCKIVEEKYHRLNGISLEVITSIYNQTRIQKLADKKDDHIATEKDINEISSALSHLWMLVGLNRTSNYSSLDELIGYVPPKLSSPSSSSVDKSKEEQP